MHSCSKNFFELTVIYPSDFTSFKNIHLTSFVSLNLQKEEPLKESVSLAFTTGIDEDSSYNVIPASSQADQEILILHWLIQDAASTGDAENLQREMRQE